MMHKTTLRKRYLLKHKKEYLELIKKDFVDGFKLEIYTKKLPFKLKHTSVIAIIPAKLVKSAVKRSKMRRQIKAKILNSDWYNQDIVVIARKVKV